MDGIEFFVTKVRVIGSHRVQIKSPLDRIQLCIFDSRAVIHCVGYRHFLILVEEGLSFCGVGDVVPDEEAGISCLLSRVPDFLHFVDENG